MSEFIKTDVVGKVAVIYLDRPGALNALNHDMINTLKDQLNAWKENNAIQMVFIHGNGRAFCAGGDIRSLFENGIDNIEKSVQYFRDEYSLNQLIHHYPKPYISYLDGITMGGGVGISLHGSHRIATPNFLFAMPETKIGFFPDIGARYELTQLPHYFGLYLALSANTIQAGSALELGIATHCCQENKADDIIQALASSDSVETTLLAFKTTCQPEDSVDSALLACYQHDSIEDIATALQKLGTEDSLKLYQDMQNKSYLSLEGTFQSYQDAIGLDFDQIIEEDLEIAKQFLSGSAFYEGIRAMVIDKDKKPTWKKTLLSI